MSPCNLAVVAVVAVAALAVSPAAAQEPPSASDTLAVTAPSGAGPAFPIAAVPDSARVGEGLPLSLFETNLNAYPYVYYTPETELAFGAGGIITFYTAETPGLRPSKVTLSAYYSTKAQYRITLGPDLYFDENKLVSKLNFDFGHYVDRYYGIGNGTVEIDSSEYVIEGWGVDVEVQAPPALALFHQTRAGASYQIKQRQVMETRGNPNLEQDPPVGIEGGLTSGLGWIWAWDTRDHLFYPRGGVYTRLSGTYYMKAIGSDYDFIRYKLDLRTYHAIREENVFAFQFLGHWTGGNPPFYELPALGGSQMLRGYYEGRFRDRLYLSGQVEFRRPLFWRLGAVGFVGLGDVGRDFSDIRIRTAQVSGGLGLRVLFNQQENVNLRIDFGVGKNTTGIYFGLEESF